MSVPTTDVARSNGPPGDIPEDRLTSGPPACPGGHPGALPDFDKGSEWWMCWDYQCEHQSFYVERPAPIAEATRNGQAVDVVDTTAVAVPPAASSDMVMADPLPGRLSETGYALPDGLPFERWCSIGASLQTMKRAINWWVGDWLLFGQRAFNDEAYQAVRDQVTEIMGRTDDTIGQAVWIAQQFPPDQRRSELYWSHHREVLLAELPVTERAFLLELAVKNRWSTRELGERARARRDALADDPEPLPAPERPPAPPLALVPGPFGPIGDDDQSYAVGTTATDMSAVDLETVSKSTADQAAEVTSDPAGESEKPIWIRVKREDFERLSAFASESHGLVVEMAAYQREKLKRKRGKALHLMGCRIGQNVQGYGPPNGAPCSPDCLAARQLVEQADRQIKRVTEIQQTNGAPTLSFGS